MAFVWAAYSDMQDRMAMRTQLQESLAWAEPSTNDEGPAWKAWRKRVGDLEPDDADSTIDAELENVCRSLRGFVAWKPDNPHEPPQEPGRTTAAVEN